MKSLAIILPLHLLIVCVHLKDLLPEIQELANYAKRKSEHFCTQINTKQNDWIADSNWSWNITMAKLMRLYSENPINNPDIAKFNYDKTKKIFALFPKNFSIREKWPKCGDIISKIPKLLLNSTCKTSWALAMASVLTDRLCIFTRGVQRAELSPVDIVQCCTTCTISQLTSACAKGGEALSAWEHWIKNGIVSGGFTEEGADSGCKSISVQRDFENKCVEACTFRDKTPAENAKIYKKERRKYRFGEEAYTIPNSERHIMNEIYQYGPVQTSFILHEDFFLYRYGIYSYAKGRRIGYHSVKIIGWGEENDSYYWLLVNTWGKTFGQNGTVKFLKGSNHLEIEQNVISCTYRRLDPKLNPLVKPPEKNAGHVSVIDLLPLVFCIHLLFSAYV